MKPSQLAKQHGTRMTEVAKGYGVLPQHLNNVFNADPKRLEGMIKTHQLASSLNIDTQHLQFALECASNTIEGTNATHYFTNDKKAREELSRALLVDFKIRMRDMCDRILDDEAALCEFKWLLMGMIGGEE